MARIAITGANRGIGLGLTKHCLATGAEVIAFCREPASAAALADLAAAYPSTLKIGALDVGDDMSVAAAAAAFPEPLDLLINNAGIFGNEDQSLAGVDTAIWLDVFNVNAIGPFRMSRAFLGQLRATKGKIAVISSHIGSSQWPLGGFYAYASAKAAVNRMIRALAIDLRKEGIAVACIHPGHVQTEMAAPGATLTPADSAAGIYDVLASLDLEASGSFLKWNGETQPW